MTYTKTFKELILGVEDTYLGKPVKKKYQKRYGKRYDKSEMKSIAYSIARSKGIKTDKGGVK